MKDIRYDVGKDFLIVSIMPTGSLPLIVSEKCGAKNLESLSGEIMRDCIVFSA